MSDDLYPQLAGWLDQKRAQRGVLKERRDYLTLAHGEADAESIIRNIILADEDTHYQTSYRNITPEVAMQCDVVFRCVNIIADQVGYLPLQVLRENEDGVAERQHSHPAIRLLRHPNNYQLESDFRKYLVQSLLLHGNAYTQVITNMRGQVTMLMPLPPENVRPKVVRPGVMEYEVDYTDFQHGGVGRRVFTDRQVLHIRANVRNPQSGMGLGVLAAAANAIGTCLEQDRFAGLLFKNRLQPGGIFVIDGADANLGETAREELRDQMQMMRGSPHRTWLMPPGVKYQAVSMNPNDAQFIEARRMSREQVATYFGVPLFMLNDTTKATSFGRGIEQQWIGFVRGTLNPYLCIIEQALTRRLLQFNGDTTLYFRFNTAPLTRADSAARWNTYKIGRETAVLSSNDVRVAEGLPPRDGGDDDYIMAPGTATENDTQNAGMEDDNDDNETDN